MSRSFASSHKYPALYQVLFSHHTPYVPPQASPLAMSVWRWRIWFESTFGLVALGEIRHRSVLTYEPSVDCRPLRSCPLNSTISNRTGIQTDDGLLPRGNHDTKQHITRPMRNTLGPGLLARYLRRILLSIWHTQNLVGSRTLIVDGGKPFIHCIGLIIEDKVFCILSDVGYGVECRRVDSPTSGSDSAR